MTNIKEYFILKNIIHKLFISAVSAYVSPVFLSVLVIGGCTEINHASLAPMVAITPTSEFITQQLLQITCLSCLARSHPIRRHQSFKKVTSKQMRHFALDQLSQSDKSSCF